MRLVPHRRILSLSLILRRRRNRMERHYFSILIHHGPTRAKTGKEFQNYDVVSPLSVMER